MSPHFMVSDDETGLVKLEEDQLTEGRGLQTWLAGHPELLGGEDMNAEDPRRFLLIRREAPVSQAEGSHPLRADHFFVDQDAVPAIVETKKADTREARRYVVAQMLDYASEASLRWSADRIKDWFVNRCEAGGLEAADELAEHNAKFGFSGFFEEVESNLRQRKMRLIFALDSIGPDLRRIIEFLNETMDPVEVLGLEVRSFKANGQTIFNASLIGATERAKATKSASRKANVIQSLLAEDELSDGDDLWIVPSVFPLGVRPQAADDPVLKTTLNLAGSAPKVVWSPPDSSETLELSPSTAPAHVRSHLDPSFDDTSQARAVHDAYSIEPGGKTLGEHAVKVGVWPG